MGIAFYFGANPILGATVFAILSALGIEWANGHGKVREDSAIGMMWGVGMAIGVLFMSLRPGYTSGDMSAFLFGNIVTITTTDIIILAVVTALLLVGAALWHRSIMFTAFDRKFAQASGVKVGLISYIMAVVTAITIVLSIRVMGIVLLISLLTMPVVAAAMLFKEYRRIAAAAVAIAITSNLIGMTFSYYAEVPSGPAIIFALTVAILIIKLLSLWVIRQKRA
jgi:zinc transport system permease protein